MKKRASPSVSGNSCPRPLRGSLGEALDAVGFKPRGTRIKVAQGTILRLPKRPKWIVPTFDFLCSALPDPNSVEWEQMHTYDAACEALTALSEVLAVVADDAEAGHETILTTPIPRWDDLATVVVGLANQVHLLEYRNFDAHRAGRNEIGKQRPNVRAAHGSGPAYLSPELFPVFESLDLIQDSQWTERAETVLWRNSPGEWSFDFTRDRRFVLARDNALISIPADIAQKVKATAVITDQSISEWLKTAKRHGTVSKTREDAIDSLKFWNRHALEHLFHRRWRWGSGWLSNAEVKRTLLVRTDALSINMCREFAARYLPYATFLVD